MYEKCPYCGNDPIQNNICAVCNNKIEWVTQVSKKSNAYYNKGYYSASAGNLSEAKQGLLKAIALDKYNIDARNLLGLVLFELGDVGEALKHWIVSQSMRKEDNLAIGYIKKMQENSKGLEVYKEALRHYNKSLRYLAKDNDDIGMIGLKKAVNLMPHFVEARNLLAACYINQKQEEKALEQIKEVLAIDGENKKALRYLKQLSLSEVLELKGSKKAHIATPYINPNIRNKAQRMINRGHTLRNAVLYFIVGAMCMFAVQVGLIMPTKTETLELERDQAIIASRELDTRLKGTIKENNNTIVVLEQENKKLKQENEQMKMNNNKMLQKERIQTVYNLKKERKWVEAAELLYNISVNDLDAANKQLYEEMKVEVFRYAADELYSMGYSGYRNANYLEAKQYFEKVALYAPGDRRAGDSLYYMGKIEEQNKNMEKSKQYYNMIIKDYSGSNAAYRAKEALDQIEQ